MRWLRLLIALMVGSLAAGVAAADPGAGGKVAFPERYAEGVMYATMDRPAKDDPRRRRARLSRASIMRRRQPSKRCATASRSRAAA
jgi:hypothetical protein